MKEHFNGLFFTKVKKINSKPMTIELVNSDNLNRVTHRSTVIINLHNSVFTAAVADKYTIDGDPYILLYIEHIGFKFFEVHSYKKGIVLVNTIASIFVNTDTVNNMIKGLDSQPYYAFDDVIL